MSGYLDALEDEYDDANREDLDKEDENETIELLLTCIGERRVTVNKREYYSWKAEGEVGHMLDVYFSNLDEEILVDEQNGEMPYNPY